MIYYLPLEYLEKRYTALMDKQLMREFKQQGKSFKRIDGELLTTSIQTGSFLDSEGTNYYKFSQLQKVCVLFKKGKVKDGDVFFISDLWFPGIEAIKYMAYFRNIQVKVKGILHAGSFTETDFVRGIEDWAKWIEKGWIQSFDTVFLGSRYIKQELIEKGRVIDFKRLKVTGLPFSITDLYKIQKPIIWRKRKDIVVFAGRLDDEKQPWQFDYVEKRFKEKYPEYKYVKFIKTMKFNFSKKQYLQFLAYSKVFFSSALQENFGYSTLEAASYNCGLVLPNKLVYPEFYSESCLYADLERAVDMIYKKLRMKTNTYQYAVRHITNICKIVKSI